MRQGAFAALCGISQPMVSKYAAAGHLVMTQAGEIDALPSLANLEGRLEEAKRQHALAFLGGASTPPRAAAGARQPGKGAKAEREEIERDLKALQLGREAGDLVLVEDVDAAGRQAVAAMREAFANSRRDIAARVCVAFAVPSEKQTALARFLGQEFERALGAFAREMQRAASDTLPVMTMQSSAEPGMGDPALI